MDTTYNPPRILILLIQMQRDHLNTWQALLAVLPLNGPWFGARGIKGAKGIRMTTPRLLFECYMGFAQPSLCRGRKRKGCGQARAVIHGNAHEQHGKGCTDSFWDSCSSAQPRATLRAPVTSLSKVCSLPVT